MTDDKKEKSKWKKALLLLLCLLLVAGGSVMGTLAYLSSQTELVKNTFTVGKVEITLDESKVDTGGTKTDAGVTRVTSNTYHLMPDKTYTKDPTIHFKAGSVESWIFIEVQNDISSYEPADDNAIATQITANGWTSITPTAPASTGTTLYYREETANDTSSDRDIPIFDHFNIRSDVSSFAGSEDDVVTIQGYAIQKADSYSTADEAWSALKAQMAP